MLAMVIPASAPGERCVEGVAALFCGVKVGVGVAEDEEVGVDDIVDFVLESLDELEEENMLFVLELLAMLDMPDARSVLEMLGVLKTPGLDRLVELETLELLLAVIISTILLLGLGALGLLLLALLSAALLLEVEAEVVPTS